LRYLKVLYGTLLYFKVLWRNFKVLWRSFKVLLHTFNYFYILSSTFTYFKLLLHTLNYFQVLWTTFVLWCTFLLEVRCFPLHRCFVDIWTWLIEVLLTFSFDVFWPWHPATHKLFFFIRPSLQSRE
jgi:hypothetical protein